MKLIVGLGNPGKEYGGNRHNLGLLCLSHFAKEQGIKFNKKQEKSRIGSGKVAGNEAVLAMPQTYMNLSGQAVGSLVRKFNVSLDDLLVIHDDMDLPLGRIRIRQGGSSGGHKGIKSIIAELCSPDFLRIRVGIGKPVNADEEKTGNDVIDYVLSDFTSEEKKIIACVVPMVSEAILCLLTEGLTAAMNKYNQKS